MKSILLEDLLDMSEQDFKEELKSRGLNVEGMGRRFEVALQKATDSAVRRLYERAKEMPSGTSQLIGIAKDISANDARILLGRLNDANVPFLLAARNGRPLSELPDAEVESLVRDLLELGLIRHEDLP